MAAPQVGLVAGAPMRSLQDRFDAKTEPEPNTGCLLWTGAKVRGGYGSMKFEGRMTGAHRIALILAGVQLTPDQVVAHSCDTPGCVRAEHLFACSQADNLADMQRKGRARPGTGVHLPEAVVVEIRKAISSGVAPKQVAEQFGVCRNTVRLISSARTQKRLPFLKSA
jgi:hypothetical protein